MIFVYIGLALLGAFVLLIVWLRLRVGWAAKGRDDRLFADMQPAMEKVLNKQPVSPEEIDALAARPELRRLLYHMLKEAQRLDLFPKKYLTPVAQAEGTLAYWMLHPNEDGDVPERMELLQCVRGMSGDKVADFYVFRYRMKQGHWHAKDGWLLGLASLVTPEETPYGVSLGVFTRGDKEGTITPDALVDWYLDMIKQKVRR